jgi:hypothetical protein
MVDKGGAARFGRVLKAEWVVTGSYGVENGTLVIEAHVIDVGTQASRRVERVRGSPGDALKLEKDLAAALVAGFGVALSDPQRARLTRMPTHSLPAAQCHYEALAHYDAGEYAEALAGLWMAVRQDTRYAEARMRLAGVYGDSGDHEHAHLELQRLSALQDGEPRNLARFLMAHLEEDYLDRAGRAAGRFLEVARDQAPGTVSPMSLQAALRAGLICERSGRLDEAYRAYRECVRLCRQPVVQPRSFTASLGWHERLAQQRIRAYVLRQWLEHARLPDTDDAFRIVSPEACVLERSRGEGSGIANGGALSVEPSCNLLVAPGFVITGMTVEVKLALRPGADPRKTPGLQGCSVYARDMSRPRDDITVGCVRFETAEAGPHRAPVAFRYPVAGCSLQVRAYPDSLLRDFRIRLRFAPAPPGLKRRTLKRLATLLVPAEPNWTVYAMQGCLDHRGDLLIAMSEGSPSYALRVADPADLSRLGSVDLWTTRAGTASPGPWRRAGFNSVRRDFHSALAVGGDGRYRMVFVSNRWSERQTSLWMTMSADGASWSHPRRLRIEVATADGRSISVEKEGGVMAPSLRIDDQNGYWLAFRAGGRYYVTRSPDGYTWPTACCMGLHYGGQGFADQALLLGADREGATFAVMHGVLYKPDPPKGQRAHGGGILLGRVRPDLTFDGEDFRPRLPYIQMKHGWRTSEIQVPLAFGQLPDGRYAVVSRRLSLSPRSLSLVLSVSRDLASWRHTALPPAGGHYTSAVACLLDTRAARPAGTDAGAGRGVDLVLMWHEAGMPRVRRIPVEAVLASP